MKIIIDCLYYGYIEIDSIVVDRPSLSIEPESNSPRAHSGVPGR